MDFPSNLNGSDMSENAFSLVSGLLEDDREAVVAAIAKIVDGGLPWIHATLYGLSTTTLGMSGKLGGKDYGILAMNVGTGEMHSLDSVGMSQEEADAARLLALSGNRDQDTIIAIARTYSEIGGDSLYELIFSVATLTAQSVMDHHEKHCPHSHHHNTNLN